MYYLPFAASISLLFPSFAVAARVGPVATIKIQNKVIGPDGFNRSAVVAGGTDLGLLITAVQGQQFKLNIVNELTDNTMLRTTSIHWHGFLQKGTTWADGAAFVSQCPVVPNHSFLYNFKADHAGTFWYHSHHRTQYCDGLRGAMVVYDLLDPVKYGYLVDDESTVITLADWYHVPAPSQGAVPRPKSILINGKGRYPGGPAAPLAVVNVIKGLTYRFRIVSISCDPNFIFSIDGHKFDVIEVDGVYHKRVKDVDSFQIFAGQRYSIIMKADQPIGNYWIRAKPNVAEAVNFDGGLNSAILRYALAKKEEPAVVDPPTPNKSLTESMLVPESNPGAPGVREPGKADVNINLALSFNGAQFLVNGVPFETPNLAVLNQILSGKHTPQELLPSGSIYVLPRNKVVELSIPAANAVGGPHPFHLHGHTFDVVRGAGTQNFNFQNPVRRDVVSIGSGTDNVTIRFTTDNPGPWILHCHIDWHLDLGLAVVFAEAPENTAAANPVPQSWKELCPLYEEGGLERVPTESQNARPLSPELLTPA